MKWNRIAYIAISLLLIVSMLSACGKSETKGTEGSKTSTAATPATTKAATTAAASEPEIPNFNPTGFPIVNEKITLKVMGMTNPSIIDDWSKNKFFIGMEELTNISFEFDVAPREAFDQKKSLAFASETLPDLFLKANFSPTEELQYGGQGLIIALNELLEKYAPNFTQLAELRPEIYNAIKHNNGNIYTLPQVNKRENYPAYYINTKWIEDAGLTMPTNLEEYYTVLKAFKEKDPNENGQADEIPMTGYVSGNDVSQILDFIQNFGLMFASHSSLAAYFFEDEGTVRYSPVQPEYKEALIYLRKLYSEKLLDNDFFTQTLEQVKAKGANYQIGVVDCWDGTTRVGEEYTLEYSAIEPFEYNGKRFWRGNPGVGRGTFAITKENKYPEATIRWVDYLYSVEGGILCNNGVEGEEWYWLEDGTWDSIIPEGKTWAEVKAGFSMQPGGQFPFRIPEEFTAKAKMTPTSAHLQSNIARIIQYYQEPFPTAFVDEATTARVATLNADIVPYVNQMLARFITGDASIESDWDEYIATLNNMGLPELQRIIEDVYTTISSK